MGKRLAVEGLKALKGKAMSDQLPVISVRKKGDIITEVNLIKIGPLWLATIPGEMLPKPGLALKASLREAGAGIAGIIGLANDELGYILPKEDFRYPLNPLNPGKHYEETMSVSKEMGAKVVEAVKSLF